MKVTAVLLRLLSLAALAAITSCKTIPPADGTLESIDRPRPCEVRYGCK